jgi:hypothetical protein
MLARKRIRNKTKTEKSPHENEALGENTVGPSSPHPF